MDEAAAGKATKQRRAWGVGSLALMLLDVVAMGWAVGAAGDGVDSGFGVATVFLLVGVPLAVAALVLAGIALVRRSGTVFAVASLAVIPLLLLAGVLWEAVAGHS